MTNSFIFRQIWFPVLLGALQAGGALAQNAGAPRFEVAEIRINNTPFNGPGAQDVQLADGRVRIINIALRMLIRIAAVGIRDTRPIIGPGVLDSVRVDVIAKAESPTASLDDMRPMIFELLKDRMKLVSHYEGRETAAYALVDVGSQSKIRDTPGQPGQCESSKPDPSKSALSHLDCRNVSMAQFASRLSMSVDRPVVDQTAIVGTRSFSFDWEFEPDAPAAAMNRSLASLGLRLAPQTLPVPVLVIDSIASSPSQE